MFQPRAIQIPRMAHEAFSIGRAAIVLSLFVVSAVVQAADLRFATELFAVGDWVGCRRECLRQLIQTPDDPTARLLDAASQIRLTNETVQALAALRALADSAGNPHVRAMAAYELGRAEWRRGDAHAAFALLRRAYSEAESPALALRAGCSLDLLRKSFPGIGENDHALLQSLEDARASWTPEVAAESLVKPHGEAGFPSRPGKWLVAFYRAQIRPALGSRCSLLPSCSEYLFLASEEHGLLAVPLIADRFVREPSVLQAGEKPVPAAGRMFFYDPLSDHDFWLTGGAE